MRGLILLACVGGLRFAAPPATLATMAVPRSYYVDCSHASTRSPVACGLAGGNDNMICQLLFLSRKRLYHIRELRDNLPDGRKLQPFDE